MKVYSYDIEIFKNYFLVCFMNIYDKTDKFHFVFEDIPSLKKYLLDRTEEKWLVGYNSINFDNSLIEFILRTPNLTIQKIYKRAQELISSERKVYRNKVPFKYLDMQRILYLDTVPMKSLKACAVNLKHHRIQDLPIEFDQLISDEDKEKIIDYCYNDCEIVVSMFNQYKDTINLRSQSSVKYNLDLMNESNSSMCNRLFEKFYSEESGIPIEEFRNTKTLRPDLKIRDCILDIIKFDSIQLNDLLNKLKVREVFEINDSFLLGNLPIQMGLGGLHSIDGPDYFEEDDEIIIDKDINSFYPALIIQYGFYPEHLGRILIDILRKIRDERLLAKRTGDTIVNESLKIVINSFFGKGLSEYSWLHDPKFAFSVTINGQLMIIMLLEKLISAGFNVISCNTDGITSKIPRNRLDEYNEICDEWMKYTKLELEDTIYKKYIRRDVNNYIALTDKGKIKVKGDFDSVKPINKACDMLVVPKAIEAFFIKGILVEEFIKGHKDIYDFCISQKVDSGYTPEYHYLDKQTNKIIKQKLQKTNRWYLTNKLHAGYLFKTKIDEKGTLKRSGINVGEKVQIFNDYFDSDDYQINYGFYIKEANKIINMILNKQQTLF